MTPEIVNGAMWAAWWLSWMAAALWRDRAAKQPPQSSQIAYRVLAVIEMAGLKAKLWNCLQQVTDPEKADVPSGVPLGARIEETLWMLTLMLAKPVVVSEASDTRSSWPAAPAVKVCAIRAIPR